MRLAVPITAALGAILVVVSNFVPLYGAEGFDFVVFEDDTVDRAQWFFGFEPVFVALAALGAGIAGAFSGARVLSGILLALGGQTIALFFSYAGWASASDDTTLSVGLGSWLGLLGGGAILAAGLMHWLSGPETASDAVARDTARPAPAAAAPSPAPPPPAAPSSPPAGWYPDPLGGSGRRYWDGSRWTESKQEVTDS